MIIAIDDVQKNNDNVIVNVSISGRKSEILTLVTALELGTIHVPQIIGAELTKVSNEIKHLTHKLKQL